MIDTHFSDTGVASITLNRPEKHNAFDDVLIQQLTRTLQELQHNADIRVVLLKAIGMSFSAGADLDWMRRMANYTHEENVTDAKALAELMYTLNRLCHPTIALVQGPAYGGGIGLIACCDIVLATPAVTFCLSEVKLGLIPAVISPYVIAKMGVAAARRYFLTAEHFDVKEAYRWGLVHEIVAENELVAKGEELAESLMRNGLTAVREAKKLIADVACQPIGATLRTMTAERIADIRRSEEAQERLRRFLLKH